MPAIIKNIPRIRPNNRGNRGINFPIYDSCNSTQPEVDAGCKLFDEKIEEEIVLLMQEGQHITVCESDDYVNKLKPCLADNIGKLYSLVLESDTAMTLGQEEDGDDILVVS